MKKIILLFLLLSSLIGFSQTIANQVDNNLSIDTLLADPTIQLNPNWSNCFIRGIEINSKCLKGGVIRNGKIYFGSIIKDQIRSLKTNDTISLCIQAKNGPNVIRQSIKITII